jgi:phosphoserine phosphatase
MGGQVLFQDALAARLDLIRPSKDDVKDFLLTKPPKLTDGVKELIDYFHSKQVNVYLVSGGFRQVAY